MAISQRLQSQAKIECDAEQIVLSGGPGYRLSHLLSVQWADPPKFANSNSITDTGEKASATDVGGSDGDDVGNEVASFGNDVGDDVGNELSCGGDDGGSEVAARKAWILEKLRAGIKLKTVSVVDHFNCSPRTAERALTALKNQGLIEYFGNTRNGHYRLVQSPEE